MLLFLSFGLLILNGLTQATVDMSKICDKRTLGHVLPHPEDCSAYIVCELQATVQYCQKGLHFDDQQKVCNWPQFSNCKLRPNINDETTEFIDHNLRPMLAIDIHTGLVIDPMTNYSSNEVGCFYFGAYFLPHPQSCRSYYLCAYGHMHQLNCGQGAMWDFRKQQCEIASKARCYQATIKEKQEISNVINECSTAGATTSNGETTNTFNPTGSIYAVTATGTTAAMGSSSSTGVTTSSTIAPTTSDGQITNNFHPTGSYHSATGTRSTAAIGSSTPTDIEVTTSYSTASIFHPTSSIYTVTATDTTGPINSSSSPASDWSVTSKTPSSLQPFFLECPDKLQSYIAHPKDCTKYFICIQGMPVQTQCPKGLLWDARKWFCTLPKYVKCFQ